MPTITLPKLHSGQWQIARAQARFVIAVCGRRFGKTKAGAALAIKAAAEGKRVWWIAPTYSMAGEGYRDIRALAYQIPGADIRESERIIRFPGGGEAQAKTGDDPQKLRGAGLDLVIFDEAAFMKADVWTDAIRPALADKQGRALFLSTPFGRNWFFDLYTKALDHPDWQVFTFPTAANPFIPAAEIEAARLSQPERVFKQEWLAEFVDDAGSVFRNIQACATADAQERRKEGRRYVCGVDLGKVNDFTVFAVIDTTTDALVYLDRFNQIDYTLQLGRLQALHDRFAFDNITIERNIGEMFIEQATRAGLPVTPFQTTAASKPKLIDDLVLAFEREAIRIIPDRVLMNELQAFTMERTTGGTLKYSAPDGAHDDTVIALALAWHAASNRPMFRAFLV